MWDGGPDCLGSESVCVWDPATNTFTPVPIPDPNHVTDIFCAGHTVLADGRVLIGGDIASIRLFRFSQRLHLRSDHLAMDRVVERHDVSVVGIPP